MTASFPPLPRYRLSPDALTQQLDEETIFLQLAGEGYYVLDDVGSHMLTVLLKTQDPARAIEQVAGDYGADPGQVRDDFMRILAELVAAEILVAD
jgi:hypothetical protein